MIVKELKSLFTEQLKNIYEKQELDTFFSYLIEEYLGIQKIDLLLNPTFKVQPEKLQCFNKAIDKLKKEEPIQYILGKTEFYGLPFKVNQNTLIPRPETEELVSWIVDSIDSSSPLHILDIGTGSGCIAISLKKQLPNASVTAIDVSDKALKIAEKNALENEVEVTFIQQNILTTNSLSKHYDIIVSNPPYVRNIEKEEIKNNVLLNEPHLALFVDDNDPLIFYSKIAKLAAKHLNRKGLLFFEINQYLANENFLMLKALGYNDIILRKDFRKNPRMIKSSLPNI